MKNNVKRICSNCKFWNPTSREYGTCELITEGMAVFLVEIIVDTEEHEINVRLETHRGFGCIEWKQADV